MWGGKEERRMAGDGKTAWKASYGSSGRVRGVPEAEGKKGQWKD